MILENGKSPPLEPSFLLRKRLSQTSLVCPTESPILKQNQNSPFYSSKGYYLPSKRNSKTYEEKGNSTPNVSKTNLLHHHRPFIQSTNKSSSTPSSTLLSSTTPTTAAAVAECTLEKSDPEQDRISFESRINSKRPSALHLFLNNLNNMSKKNETSQQPQMYSNPLEVSCVPRKTMLFQLEQMINEDKAVINRRSFNKSADISSQSLLISQNALVLPKNASIFSPTSKSHQRNSFSINGTSNKNSLLFKSNKNSLPYFSQSRKDSLVSDTPNPFFQQSPNQLKMDCQKATKQQSLSLSPSPKSTGKTVMPGYEKIKQQRKLNERRILSQIEHRVKTFSRFGFKMIEKEDQTHSVGPFIQASSPHDPKGTMFVSDLWSDATILKFLGNCNMIRDKLTLNKLCKKKQTIPLNSLTNNNNNALPGTSSSTRVRNDSQEQPPENQCPQENATQIDPIVQKKSIIQDDQSLQDEKIEASIIKEFYLRIAKKQKEAEESKREYKELDNSTQKVAASQGQSSTRSSPVSDLGTAHSKNNSLTRSFKIKGKSQEQRKNSPKLQSLKLSNAFGNLISNYIVKPKKIDPPNTKEKDVLKVQNWIKQLDFVTKDNDKTYDELNKRIDELQDAILKSNEFNKFVNE